jgi:type VI secretion system VasD/TssJ family lipoprotein
MISLSFCLISCAKKNGATAGPQGSATPTPTAAASAPAGPAGPVTEGTTPARVFWPKGIQIQYTSAPNLNFYENRPHTILLVVYQLSGLNAYQSFFKTPDGLGRLLQADRFDPSVVGVDQFFVEPNEKKTLVLDRVENAQFVAVIAGYYDLQPGQINRTFEIPVITDKKGVYGFRTTVSSVGQLNITLFMGPNSLHEVIAQ